jgi:predicted regulator of Ras-like GTPase activity (Roadblock/LC7/MglB family)
VRELERVEGEKAALLGELQRTRARLYKAPTNSGTFAVEEAGSGSPTERGGVEWALGQLVEEVAARGAVVADALGFPVAASGESDLVEQLAAMTGVAARVGEQARSLLTCAEIVEVTVRDRDGLVVHTRFFPVEEDVMAVGVMAESLPEPASVDRVVVRTVRGLTEPRTESTEPELRTTAR